ncbi:MAG: hypothetical protein ACLPTZ_11295 [Beijerinckiaceae bacterium]
MKGEDVVAIERTIVTGLAASNLVPEKLNVHQTRWLAAHCQHRLSDIGK